MGWPPGQGPWARNDEPPLPTNSPDRVRIGPSTPSEPRNSSGQKAAGQALSTEELEATLEKWYQAGVAAEDHGEKREARDYYERIAAAHAGLPVVAAALAMSKLARMADVDGSRGVAANRYRQAAHLWATIADHAAARGDQTTAQEARAEARNEVVHAEAAEQGSRAAYVQQAGILHREQELKSDQWRRTGR